MGKKSDKSEILQKLADESDKTKRAREKLQKHIVEVDRQVSQTALKKKSDEIHRWIERNVGVREVLKKKTISLFDGNQNSAKESVKIEQLTEELQREFEKK
ncbi:MAG: hypothetical protein WDZ28_05920 [Simkaniaceae bacterium]